MTVELVTADIGFGFGVTLLVGAVMLVLIAAAVADMFPKKRKGRIVVIPDPPSTSWGEIIAGVFSVIAMIAFGLLFFAALPYVIGAGLVIVAIIIVGCIISAIASSSGE